MQMPATWETSNPKSRQQTVANRDTYIVHTLAYAWTFFLNSKREKQDEVGGAIHEY